jgi:hypothetical protein
MLETATRQLSKALRTAAGQGPGANGEEAVERAKAAIASLNRRLATHCDVHGC